MITKEEILAMEAGNTLDRLVHETVIGLCDHNWVIDKRFKEEYHYRCTKCKRKFDSVGHFLLPKKPNYSTDISAAWQVVKKLTVYCMFHLKKVYRNTKWEASFEGNTAEGETAPEAICKAALIWRQSEK